MKAFPVVRLAPGTRLLSRRQYQVRLLVLWLYSVVWFGALVLLSFVWRASGITKGVAFVLLGIGTPALSDLFSGYAEYKALWDASQRPSAPPP